MAFSLSGVPLLVLVACVAAMIDGGALVAGSPQPRQEAPAAPNLSDDLVPSCAAASALLPASRSYALSIGKVSVSGQAEMDLFSGADVQVRAERRDERIRRIAASRRNQTTAIGRRIERIGRQASGLDAKDALSRPSPPLSKEERERRSLLSSRIQAVSEGTVELGNAELESAKAELRLLDRKDMESKRKLGPPLTEDERNLRRSLDVRKGELERMDEFVREELACVLSLVEGRTPERSRKSGNYNFRRAGTVLEVYEGDRLRITVVDIDIEQDDLFGEYVVDVTREVIDKGGLRLQARAKVSQLELIVTPLF